MASNRKRWFACLVIVVAILGSVFVYRSFTTFLMPPSGHLAMVVSAAQPGFDKDNIQLVGVSLATLGRDDEVRKTDFMPSHEMPSLNVKRDQLEINIVPWREGIEKISAQHQLVMINESHFASKHREMIGAALPILKDAGFTHYAVESIGESASALKERGYPIVETGFYTSDPQFGNTLRLALKLKFNVLGYDFDFTSHEAREEFAATELAKLFQNDPKTRLLVHTGGDHVLKNETSLGQRWLASILFEPFTISQLSSMHDNLEYDAILPLLQQEIEDFTEPVLLMPPPNKNCGLTNIQDVDAILVHPPDKSTAPSERTVLFPADMQQVSGKWLTKQWPVVISAYNQGEPTSAVPLDQVMLKTNEQDFTLWLPPSTKYTIVVFDQKGVLESGTEHDQGSVLVRAK